MANEPDGAEDAILVVPRLSRQFPPVLPLGLQSSHRMPCDGSGGLGMTRMGLMVAVAFWARWGPFVRCHPVGGLWLALLALIDRMAWAED